MEAFDLTGGADEAPCLTGGAGLRGEAFDFTGGAGEEALDFTGGAGLRAFGVATLGVATFGGPGSASSGASVRMTDP